jgi:hypothetical protein
VSPGRAGVLAIIMVLAAGSAVRAAPAEGIVIIDLRAEAAERRRADRVALAGDLSAAEGVTLPGDTGVAAALAADPLAPLAATAAAHLTAAASAYGALECDVAEARAGDAIEALAALRAAGEDRAEALRQALVYRLMCAHGRADTAGALRAAAMLRALGDDTAPRGVPGAVWQTYPAVDATTDRRIGELQLTTEPGAAAVQIDLLPAGTAPVSAPLAEGEHLVAAAAGDGAVGRTVTVGGDGATRIALSIPVPARTDLLVAVRSWRAGGGPPDPAGLGALLGGLGVRFAAVIQPDGQVQVWGLGPGDTSARKLGEPVGTAAEIAKVVQTRADAWRSRAPDPDLPLMVEAGTGPPRVDGDGKRPHEWWVYASIIGAVAVGAAVILVNDLADDRQRFELTWP